MTSDADDRERWNDRYRNGSHQGTAPAAFVVAAAASRPAPGRVLDVAGGAGRNAVFLARAGFDVTVADVSDVALELARERAADVPLATVRVDLEREPFPAGPWDVVLCFHYLHRPLFAALVPHLSSGGQLWFCQPTVLNLERHPRPSRRFLLELGEAATLVAAAGLRLSSIEEDWSGEGRHEARVKALAPG
jgi:SAM-dependent methyltransferase